MKCTFKQCGAIALLAAGATVSAAEPFPIKPIHMVTALPAGVDAYVRVLADRFAAQLGQSVVVDNRAGAGGALGSDMVAKAAPDGYTILISSSAHAINPSVHLKMRAGAERSAVGHLSGTGLRLDDEVLDIAKP